VFAQAREKARQTACLSNMRQLSTAMLMYTEDNDGLFPPVVGRDSRQTSLYLGSWMHRIEPYTKNRGVFICPSSGRTSLEHDKNDDLLRNYGYAPTSRIAGYERTTVVTGPFGEAMFEGIGGFYGPPVGDFLEDTPSYSQAQIARPVETILLCDQATFDWGFADNRRSDIWFPVPRHLKEPTTKASDGRLVPQGILNATFVDGHVKALRHEAFWRVLPRYTFRFNASGEDVFAHFWPYE
jgi:prepilin-type processing-associated H-X9-DG protein